MIYSQEWEKPFGGGRLRRKGFVDMEGSVGVGQSNLSEAVDTGDRSHCHLDRMAEKDST